MTEAHAKLVDLWHALLEELGRELVKWAGRKKDLIAEAVYAWMDSMVGEAPNSAEIERLTNSWYFRDMMAKYVAACFIEAIGLVLLDAGSRPRGSA